MPRPRLAPYFEVKQEGSIPTTAFDTGAFGAQREFFVVIKGGYCMGYWWKRGDIVVCAPVRKSTANVVLMPKGYGWPRLGRQSGYGTLSGDAGEPCRLDRWSVSGAIEFVLRLNDQGEWRQSVLGELLEAPGDVQQGWDLPLSTARPKAVAGWGEVAVSAAAECGQQLSLFTRPAIAA